MSDNVESLRTCTRCVQKFPVEDWGMKPNGDYYQYCNACRVDNRAIWYKKPKEIKDAAAQNTKDKLLYDPEYRQIVLSKLDLLEADALIVLSVVEKWPNIV